MDNQTDWIVKQARLFSAPALVDIRNATMLFCVRITLTR